MGATNTTSHYNLSQFVATDKPAWLQDYNGDMAKIDAGIDEAKVLADTAQTTANSATSASTQNANDITALQTSVNGICSNVTSIQSSINTIQSLIGNGTPTTTDQTIIGAINELHADSFFDFNTSTEVFSTGSAGDTTIAYTIPSDGMYSIRSQCNTAVANKGNQLLINEIPIRNYRTDVLYNSVTVQMYLKAGAVVKSASPSGGAYHGLYVYKLTKV